ncbi:MAG: helix-turn-helix domain-containing protein [Caldilineae bacterium]|nr:MAG: helix-turn-helix domain-containing protein [Caldilineae bacterium]
MPAPGPNADPSTETLGQRIKRIRKQQNMTLTEVAAAANLSASHLSQIERDKTTPSLMTLASVAEALHVSVRELFTSPSAQILVRRAYQQAPPSPVEQSYRAELLTASDNAWQIQVVRLTLQPGSCPLALPAFSGEILAFVLEGRLGIEMEGEDYCLEPGDSIHFDATVPHQLRCMSEQPCVVLWCSSPPDRQNLRVWEADTADHTPHNQERR